MAIIELSLTVSNISSIITLYDRIVIYRSLTESGTYSEISTVITRPVLLAGLTSYMFTDYSAPADVCWYRISYLNSGTLDESAQLAPFRGYATYITVQSLRDEGITTTELSNDRALSLILGWQQWIDKATGQFFTPKELTLDFDGDGSRLLQLPVPIITCNALYINDDFTNALATSQYAVYNRRGPVQDDRKNPCIKLKSAASGSYSIFTSNASNGGIFAIGDMNIRVQGIWGYTESDDSTPIPIKRALRILVLTSKELLSDDDLDQLKVGRVIEEVTDRHRITYSDLYDRLHAWNPTGITEVDLALRMYRAPMHIDAPRNVGLFV